MPVKECLRSRRDELALRREYRLANFPLSCPFMWVAIIRSGPDLGWVFNFK